jgi:hypothetical protein
MSLVVSEKHLSSPIPLSSCLPRCIWLFATWCAIAVDPSRRRADDFRLSPLASLCEATFSLGVVLLSPKLLLTHSPPTTLSSLVGSLACCLSPHFFSRLDADSIFPPPPLASKPDHQPCFPVNRNAWYRFCSLSRIRGNCFLVRCLGS